MVIKKIATVFGGVLLLVGILGFIPGITTDDGMLLGIFHVNALHNVIHLVTGAAAIYCGMQSGSAARTFFQVFGVVYALVAVLGFVYGDDAILGLVASNMADTWLHVVIAAASLFFGFAAKDDAAAA